MMAAAMTASPLPPAQYKLVEITKDMVEDLTEMYLDAYSTDPANRLMYPPLTPENRKIVVEHRLKVFKPGAPEPGMHRYAIVDTSLPSANPAVPEGRIVGQGIWKVENGEIWNHPWEKTIAPNCNPENFRIFFAFIDAQRNELVGGKKLWHLVFLYTDPRYPRRGAGRFFVEWGTKQAEEMGMDCYLDATEAGRKLYSSCGFTTVDERELDLAKLGGEGTCPSYAMMKKPQ